MRLGLLMRRMALDWNLSRRQRVDFGTWKQCCKEGPIWDFYIFRSHAKLSSYNTSKQSVESEFDQENQDPSVQSYSNTHSHVRIRSLDANEGSNQKIGRHIHKTATKSPSTTNSI